MVPDEGEKNRPPGTLSHTVKAALQQLAEKEVR
jgi:hypothetical protein